MNKAAEILDETDQKLWRALFAHVDAAWADMSWENVVWVGADEMNRRKGHNYLTVFADLEARRVLLALEGEDAGTWAQFAEEMGRHNGHPKAITQIAIDMPGVHQRGEGELRQRDDLVRQLSCGEPSEYGSGGSAAQGSAGRCGGAGAVGADELVVTEKSGGLNRSAAGALGTVCRTRRSCRRQRALPILLG